MNAADTGHGSPLDISPDRAQRATAEDGEGQGAGSTRAVPAGPPLKQHGDALLDGSGSRQGLSPDPVRDAAPHE